MNYLIKFEDYACRCRLLKKGKCELENKECCEKNCVDVGAQLIAEAREEDKSMDKSNEITAKVLFAAAALIRGEGILGSWQTADEMISEGRMRDSRYLRLYKRRYSGYKEERQE